MRVKDLFKNSLIKKPLAQASVCGISDDSRKVSRGDIFFIISRNNFDIFSVLGEVDKKVLAFVCSQEDKKKVEALSLKKPVIFTTKIRKEFFRVVDLFYPVSGKELKLIGITGTNGKTTTAFLIYNLLKSLGKKVSLMSTITYIIGNKNQTASHTTPDFLSLRKIIHKAKKIGSSYVVMEVSSHAIDQERIRGLKFSHCVFTNLSRDHLDYHKTMLKYYKVKKKFFTANKNAFFIINSDDYYGKRLIINSPKAISYGTNQAAKIKATNIKLKQKSTAFDLKVGKMAFDLKLRLLGRHNVLNALAALATVSSLGFAYKDLTRAICGLRPIEGRLQRVALDIFVDYAHTPDALSKTLKSLKGIGYGRIISLFGCGGDRDCGKRKLMGEVSASLAEYTIITSDNPRSEDPLAICRQISKGFAKKNYSIIIKRKQAIAKAIDMLKKNEPRVNSTIAASCLLVAGKGHEDYQIIKDKKFPSKDSRLIRDILKK
tara:strand:+ start:672 stop:2135 length:1464 start_codon:yes stop_codon:yes gene_type:complete